MKTLNQYINEWLIKKKLDKAKIKEYEYAPKSNEELKRIICKLLNDDITDLNCIDVSNVRQLVRTLSPTELSHYGLKREKMKNINNIDISEWDVSNVETMYQTFIGNFNFNCDLSNWDVSNVYNMEGTFCGCLEITDNGIGNWNMKKVETIEDMFRNCSKFNGDLSNWDTSNIFQMRSAFMSCKNFEGKGLKNWDVSNVKNFCYMFSNSENFEQDLNKWKLRDDARTQYMFDYCEKMKNKFPNWYKE